MIVTELNSSETDNADGALPLNKTPSTWILSVFSCYLFQNPDKFEGVSQQRLLCTRDIKTSARNRSRTGNEVLKPASVVLQGPITWHLLPINLNSFNLQEQSGRFNFLPC